MLSTTTSHHWTLLHSKMLVVRYFLSLMLALGLCSVMSCANAEIPQQLRVCGDIGEFPPFTFYERNGLAMTKTVTGLNVDFLDQILAASGRKAVYTLLPWKRCLAQASEGLFDIVLDVINTPDRQKYFAFPDPLYSMTGIYVYRTESHITGLKISDFKNTKFCVPLGWNIGYAHIPPEAITGQPATAAQAIEMLKMKRCDVAMYQIEVARGDQLIGKKTFLNDPSISFGKMDEFPSTEMNMVVSRAVPYKEELVSLISTGIKDMNLSLIHI